jgi:hypothetical protein
MLSMIANPVTALPVGYPRSGLSRSDLVLWSELETDQSRRPYPPRPTSANDLKAEVERRGLLLVAKIVPVPAD